MLCVVADATDTVNVVVVVVGGGSTAIDSSYTPTCVGTTAFNGTPAGQNTPAGSSTPAGGVIPACVFSSLLEMP